MKGFEAFKFNIKKTALNKNKYLFKFIRNVLIILILPNSTPLYSADCSDVDASTVTISSNCEGRLSITGDSSNVTINSGVRISGDSDNDYKFGIDTTDGTNTTITNNGNIGPTNNSDTHDLYRYSIYHNTGTGSISAINNNGAMGAHDNGNTSVSSVIYNMSTIGNINNAASGTMWSDGRNNIVNGRTGVITKIDNDGSITSDNRWTIKNINGGQIGEIDNSGTIEAGIAVGNNTNTNAGDAAIRNYGATITTITNSGTIEAIEQTIQNEKGGVIDTITNSGTITASGRDQQAIRVDDAGSIIRTIINTGTISATLNNQYVDRGTIRVIGGGEITTITNSGTISGLGAKSSATIYIGELGTIGTITNSGTISSRSKEGSINNHGSVVIINNSGTITNTNDDTESAAIRNTDSGTITTITNTGTITGENVDIRNANNGGYTGIITTLNNDQGGSDALTYSHALPTNYNVIINSTSDYGKIIFSDKSGTTIFGVHSSSSLSDASIGSTYSAVINGLTENDLESCTSDTSCTTGEYFADEKKYDWKLDDTNGDDIWDLIVTDINSSVPNNEILKQIPILDGLNSLKSVTDANFAHMNTYDCDFFAHNNKTCLSLGVRRSEVTNPRSTIDGLVLVTGSKLSNQLRIGGFYHSNFKSDTGNNLKLSDNTPLFGGLIVWNENESGLGYQVKYANAYQQKDATITRPAGENSEEATGSTKTSALSNTLEVRYNISKNNKINYSPYFAARHAIKKQYGYTEEGVSAPLTYNEIQDRAITVLLGTRFDLNLSSALRLHGSVGIEQDIYHTISALKPTGMSGLATVNFNESLQKTRPIISLGSDYYLSPNIKLSSILQYQELPYKNMTQTNMYFYVSTSF